MKCHPHLKVVKNSHINLDTCLIITSCCNACTRAQTVKSRTHKLLENLLAVLLTIHLYTNSYYLDTNAIICDAGPLLSDIVVWSSSANLWDRGGFTVDTSLQLLLTSLASIATLLVSLWLDALSLGGHEPCSFSRTSWRILDNRSVTHDNREDVDDDCCWPVRPASTRR